jgi:hypothetical protein
MKAVILLLLLETVVRADLLRNSLQDPRTINIKEENKVVKEKNEYSCWSVGLEKS